MLSFDKNRILDAIARMETQIGNRIKSGQTTVEKVESLRKELDLDLLSYCKFQEMKSLASCDGTMSLDEANTVYGYLGNTVEHFNAQPVAVKAVLTQVFGELLKKRM